MFSKRLLSAVFLFSLNFFSVYAGMTLDHYEMMNSIGDPTYYFKNPNNTWVHLKIIRNSSDTATNGKPPSSEVRIIEALTTNYSNGPQITVTWLPFPHDIDTGGREAELATWMASPRKAPEIGSEWIVRIEKYDLKWFVASMPIFPGSKISQVKDWIAQTKIEREHRFEMEQEMTRLEELDTNGKNGLLVEDRRLELEKISSKIEKCQRFNPCRPTEKNAAIGAGSSITYQIKVDRLGKVLDQKIFSKELREGVPKDLEHCTSGIVEKHEFPQRKTASEFLLPLYYPSTPGPCAGFNRKAK